MEEIESFVDDEKPLVVVVVPFPEMNEELSVEEVFPEPDDDVVSLVELLEDEEDVPVVWFVVVVMDVVLVGLDVVVDEFVVDEKVEVVLVDEALVEVVGVEDEVDVGIKPVETTDTVLDP